MGNSVKPAPQPAIIVFGLSAIGKPRAGTFKGTDVAAARKAAAKLGLTVTEIADPAGRALAAKIPSGRIGGSADGIVAFVSKEIYEQIKAIGPQQQKNGQGESDATVASSAVQVRLPANWDSRNLVRQISRGGGNDVFRTRQSTLDGHLPFLDAQWTGGCRNGTELCGPCPVIALGFKGSLRVVSEWATRRRRANKASDQQLQRIPAARTIAKLMTTKRDHLTKSETVTVAAIDKGVPTLADARALVDRFQAMIRGKTEAELEALRIIQLKGSLIASFCKWHRPRQGSGARRGSTKAVVQRPSGGSDHQAQARQTANVWACQARPPSGQANWRPMTWPSSRVRQSQI